jgi:8-oxo-dGTP diphosphatase
MTYAPGHSVSVAGAVVNDAGHLLAIRRRDNGRWEPPGGVLEVGETLHEGLRREVEEETGLAIEADALTGVYQNMARGIIAFVFRCHVVGGAISPVTFEASEVAWLTPAEVAARMAEAYAVRLLDALAWTNGARGPALRSHDGVRLLPADAR